MIEYEKLKSADAAIVFIGGQSNAHAHSKKIRNKEDKIKVPLKNVWTLMRNPNQSFDIEDVVWSGFTTKGYNLGETQDDTYSFAYYLALRWQKAKDEGKPLPDLYIVQMSIGSQAILNGLWNKDIAPVLIPGRLGIVWISLYWLAQHINPLVMKNMKARFENPVVLGWHWIGSDQDTMKGGYDNPQFRERYDEFFDTMLPTMDYPPLYLYKPVYYRLAQENELITPEGICGVTEELRRQMTRYPKSMLVEVDHSPLWKETYVNSGVFGRDKIHYRKETHEWMADRFFREVMQDWHMKTE